MTSTLTYVYCLVRSARRPSISATLNDAGIPGGRDTRAVAAGRGLWMIAATVPAQDYSEAALAAGLQDMEWVGPRALAHEAVVEHFLSSAGVLPMQLFTLFRSDERALEHVARERRAIDRILTRLERKLEWGLRVTFDEAAAREAVTRTHARSKTTSASGTSYLARKRDLLDVSRVQLTEARAAADRLYRSMSRMASDARRRTATEQSAPGSRLLLDAAFLVPSAKARSFRAALGREAKAGTAQGLEVSLTGPWPPYNFISAPEPKRRGRKT